MSKERKYYLDYLRLLPIVLLFPVHTSMCWNDFGSKFYVWGGGNKFLSCFIVFVNPWLMPILFAIAGICAKYALERKGEKLFVMERVKKLLIPFFLNIILLVPIQTFYTRKFFFHYEGSFLENMEYFFTHITDFTGYDGCFTTAHLWFILFLFVISILGLFIARLIPWKKVEKLVDRLPVLFIIALFIVVWLSYYVGNIGGFSIGKDFMLYILGYYVLSNEKVMEKLDQYCILLFILFLLCSATLSVLYYFFSYYGDIGVNFIGWLGICAMIPFFRRYMNKKTRILAYLNKASFPIYLIHQTILVTLSYYVMLYVKGMCYQVLIIMIGTFVLTLIAYELIKRIPYVRLLIGIK